MEMYTQISELRPSQSKRRLDDPHSLCNLAVFALDTIEQLLANLLIFRIYSAVRVIDRQMVSGVTRWINVNVCRNGNILNADGGEGALCEVGYHGLVTWERMKGGMGEGGE